MPASLAAYYAQQLKWARGTFELLLRVYPRLCRRWSGAQRLHYATLPLYFASGIIVLIDLTIPIASLLLTEFPLHVSLWELSAYALPLLCTSLLIRIYSQRWLREPHEAGLHLAGGFLRVGTWWIYVLGFVYALLRVRVPYVPTPKEDHKGNEWKLALPNLVVVALAIGASKFGRVQALTPYTNMMVALCLLNAGILLAATFMGQYKMVQNLIHDMTTRPYRPLWLWMERLMHSVSRIFVPRLRSRAGIVALAILVSTAGIQLSFVPASTALPDWMKKGDYTLRIGKVMPLELSERAQAGFDTHAEAKHKRAALDIVAFDLPANSSFSLPQALLSGQQNSEQAPLISWDISPDSARSTHYVRRVATQLGKLSGGVMLRPKLPTLSVNAHRLAWREMVSQFRRAGVRNAVWVWTSPQADSVAHYSPDRDYFDWVSTTVDTTRSHSYDSLRAQMATIYDLHSKPVLLLYTKQAEHSYEAVAKSLAYTYPEIDAVIFAPQIPMENSISRQSYPSIPPTK